MFKHSSSIYDNKKCILVIINDNNNFFNDTESLIMSINNLFTGVVRTSDNIFVLSSLIEY